MQKVSGVAFWGLTELTKETNYPRNFIISIHIAFSADSSFTKLLFIPMEMVTNKVGLSRSCCPDHCLVFLLSHHIKHQQYSATCKGSERNNIRASSRWDKCIWWLAIIRCQAALEWQAPSVSTQSVSNFIRQIEVWVSRTSAKAF